MDNQGKFKILLLENDPLWINLCKRLIQRAGFECVQVETISGFWEVFNTSFVAVILDDGVNDGRFITNGYGSGVAEIRKLAPEMPIGLNSASPNRETSERCGCEDLNKDMQEIKSFLQKVQVLCTS